jgi:hypothetical protein
LQIHVEIITDNKPNYSHQGLIIVICENTEMLDKYNMLNVRAFGKRTITFTPTHKALTQIPRHIILRHQTMAWERDNNVPRSIMII